ncbi:MAG: galactokinase family protein [Bacteroidota bacterium]|jgi:galactokinase
MIRPDTLQDWLSHLYGSDREILSRQTRRWSALVEDFHSRFGTADPRLFSTPGRTEIGGNHTDHNHGKVLAASINLDSIAAAAPSPEKKILVHSEGYTQPFCVNLDDLAPAARERGTTTALVRGIAARFRELGYRIGGFNACVTSDVLVGSGLSSSASVEVLLATIMNTLYNDGRVAPQTIAFIGQFSENTYFGKPCGLMDQTACATGGMIMIDFKDPDTPRVERFEFDFAAAGYNLLVVNTGGHHADLTEEYASIPREMKSVAAQFGKEWCRDISKEDILKNVRRLRKAVGDRAVSRALHFIDENERVDSQVAALRKGDVETFLRLVTESGRSSHQWLQNCYAAGNASEQGVALGLALTEQFLRKTGSGGYRVHGGGFAGTILAFLPHERVGEYIAFMESAFATGCVKQLTIRSIGTTCFMEQTV